MTEDTQIITLELDAAGEIIGPKLIPNTSPASKVYYPKAGLGIIQDERSSNYDGERVNTYHIPNDPNALFMSCPKRGEQMPSIYALLLL